MAENDRQRSAPGRNWRAAGRGGPPGAAAVAAAAAGALLACSPPGAGPVPPDQGGPGVIGAFDAVPLADSGVDPGLASPVGYFYVVSMDGEETTEGVATLVRGADGAVNLLTAGAVAYDMAGERRGVVGAFARPGSDAAHLVDISVLPARLSRADPADDLLQVPLNSEDGVLAQFADQAAASVAAEPAADESALPALNMAQVGLSAAQIGRNALDGVEATAIHIAQTRGGLAHLVQQGFTFESNPAPGLEFPWPAMATDMDGGPAALGSPIFVPGPDGPVLAGILTISTARADCAAYAPETACLNTVVMIE